MAQCTCRTPGQLRFFFTLATDLIVGITFWKVGSKINNSHDLNIIIGAMYQAVMYVGITNCGTVQPVVAIERTVFYRERAAGMYSALPYAIAQVVVEIPYVFVQAAYYSNYSVIVYAMVSFKLTAAKFLWFFYISFFSFLYWTCYGMMTVSITQNQEIASAFYALFNLFSGFFIPRPRIPKWWAWYCWICPVAWTVYGLIISQYGDQTKMIQIMGTSTNQTIADYVQENFGFDPDIMIPVAVVLAAFTVFFAFIFAFCIKILNFKTR